jgi:hypothetical protein
VFLAARLPDGAHNHTPLGRRRQLDFYFFFLESVPYRNASRVFLRSAASRNRRRSAAVFKISGGTSFGFRVCSSIATNVT